MSTATQEAVRKDELNQESAEPRRVYTPAVDILEKQDMIIVTADMPGVDEHSVDITLEKDILTIKGRVEQDIPEGYRLVFSEYGVGDYQRSFTLSEDIDWDRIEASVRNGVLRLSLPKAAARTRKIAVSAA